MDTIFPFFRLIRNLDIILVYRKMYRSDNDNHDYTCPRVYDIFYKRKETWNLPKKQKPAPKRVRVSGGTLQPLSVYKPPPWVRPLPQAIDIHNRLTNNHLNSKKLFSNWCDWLLRHHTFTTIRAPPCYIHQNWRYGSGIERVIPF